MRASAERFTMSIRSASAMAGRRSMNSRTSRATLATVRIGDCRILDTSARNWPKVVNEFKNPPARARLGQPKGWEMAHQTVVLAYSGGLDTSVAIPSVHVSGLAD